MAPLVDRTQFRAVLKEIVRCLRQNLDVPGIAPLTSEQIMFWLQNVSLEDVQAVTREIEAEQTDRTAWNLGQHQNSGIAQ